VISYNGSPLRLQGLTNEAGPYYLSIEGKTDGVGPAIILGSVKGFGKREAFLPIFPVFKVMCFDVSSYLIFANAPRGVIYLLT